MSPTAASIIRRIRIGVLLVIAAALLAHATFSYYAVDQLRRSVSALERTGKPIYSRQLRAGSYRQEGEYKSERYFAAAAALFSGRSFSPERVSDHGEVFRLVDLAASPSAAPPSALFDGMAWSPLVGIHRLNRTRIAERIAAGDLEGTSTAVLADLRLRQLAQQSRYEFILMTSPTAHEHVARALTGLNVTGQTLTSWAAPLRDLDDDDLLAKHFIQMRAYHLDYIRSLLRGASPARPGMTNWLLAPMSRSWELLDARDALEVHNAWIDASSLPWSERLDRLNTVALGADTPYVRDFLVGRGNVERLAEHLASVRVAAALVALERHRRANDELPAALSDLVPQYLSTVPIDPFSGAPLRFDADAASYRIYSLGPDRKDGGAAVLEFAVKREFNQTIRVTDGVDIGAVIPIGREPLNP